MTAPDREVSNLRSGVEVEVARVKDHSETRETATMKTREALIVLALFAAGGCATDQSQSPQAGIAQPTTQQETAMQAREHRSLAYALREMADRRQFEADLLMRDLGPDDPAVQRKRQLAEDLRAAAAEAEGEARQLRSAVPHNMVQ
jgi:hypothetical protein